MKHTAVKEFSRFAHSYNAHNVIQDEVARELVTLLPKKVYPNMVDVGCGSGAVYKYLQEQEIAVSHFIALDSSDKMLEIHPDNENIEKICADFNTPDAFSLLREHGKHTLISASALQWSSDLDFTFSSLSKNSEELYVAIFTSGTFKTLHEIADIKSPIYTRETLESSINNYFDANFELKRYKLHFDSVQKMFRYIKRSGVSGGEKQLSYKETKLLMKNYPLDYLEFEVLFVKARPLQIFS